MPGMIRRSRIAAIAWVWDSFKKKSRQISRITHRVLVLITHRKARCVAYSVNPRTIAYRVASTRFSVPVLR